MMTKNVRYEQPSLHTKGRSVLLGYRRSRPVCSVPCPYNLVSHSVILAKVLVVLFAFDIDLKLLGPLTWKV
jgi:hypothetical protein